uniref:Uncharacterized protein n=1 Tax=Heterosigma akashiwo TaxID=2829 RepID=A0A7S3YIA3_HETAK
MDGQPAFIPEQEISKIRASISAQAGYDLSFHSLLYIHHQDPSKPIKCRISGIGENWIDFTYKVIVAGPSLLNVVIGKIKVSRSPYLPNISPGNVEPRMSELYVPKDLYDFLKKEEQETKDSTFQCIVNVTGRDGYGNKVRNFAAMSNLVNTTLVFPAGKDLGSTISLQQCSGSPGNQDSGMILYELKLQEVPSAPFHISCQMQETHVLKSPAEIGRSPPLLEGAKDDNEKHLVETLSKLAQDLDANIDKRSLVQQSKSVTSDEGSKLAKRIQMEQMTKKRAQQALQREQTRRRAERERMRKKASCKRTGGGFVIQYSQDI